MRKILFIISFFLISGLSVSYSSSNLDILTLFSSNPKSQNSIWVGTFQLVFNEIRDNIIKKDIVFKGKKPTEDLKGLNAKEFDKTMLNNDSYYVSYGKTSPEAKELIIKEIKKKFNETSDILNSLDWQKGIGRYYAYAMLKKEFKFINEFDILEKSSFNNSIKKYEFFGISENSKKLLKNGVKVLFYNNEDDYAVQLNTKNNDIVYLYRTDKNNNFSSLYKKMIVSKEAFKGDKRLNENDTLKVPYLKIKDTKYYPELINKFIEGTDGVYISQAIETIELELDNKGGKVKSEAAVMMDSVMVVEKTIRNFNFDKTFVMFLIDNNKTNPYLALRVQDLENIGK